MENVIYISNSNNLRIDEEHPKSLSLEEIVIKPFYKYNDCNISFRKSNSFNNSCNLIYVKKDKLLLFIKESKLKINNYLFIITSKYDNLYYKYNTISLFVLILSTIITFNEALRLTFVNYIDSNKDINISSQVLSLILNILSLFLGTLLTILSSIIKFKNYSIKMENLKKMQEVLFNYKNLYNKQKQLIIFFEINNIFTDELFENLYSKIVEYNNDIKEINIFEEIRVNDLTKIYNNKQKHDIEIDKLKYLTK
jgi:hypothetical protein